MYVHAKNEAKYVAYVATCSNLTTYFKLTLKDYIDLDMPPLNMYISLRYICMQNMKFLFVIV